MTDDINPVDLTQCPCCSGLRYSACCAPLLEGKRCAEMAQTLMRSRFTAYARNNTAYLLESWHPETRPAALDPAFFLRWKTLAIINTEEGAIHDTTGTVEFKATAFDGKSTITLHEKSRFVREGGQWLYYDGDIVAEGGGQQKIGRNNPCPCGSGKKFKKCCAVISRP